MSLQYRIIEILNKSIRNQLAVSRPAGRFDPRLRFVTGDGAFYLSTIGDVQS